MLPSSREFLDVIPNSVRHFTLATPLECGTGLRGRRRGGPGEGREGGGRGKEGRGGEGRKERRLAKGEEMGRRRTREKMGREGKKGRR